jgi:hypothetical protein
MVDLNQQQKNITVSPSSDYENTYNNKSEKVSSDDELEYDHDSTETNSDTTPPQKKLTYSS